MFGPEIYLPLNRLTSTPKGRRGGLLQGSFMRLVSLWWEFGLPGLIPILGYLDPKSNSFL